MIDTLRRRGEPARAMALASEAGGMRIVSGTLSMSHRPVGQVIFARRIARTCAVSGKSPTRNLRLGIWKRALVCSRQSRIISGLPVTQEQHWLLLWPLHAPQHLRAAPWKTSFHAALPPYWNELGWTRRSFRPTACRPTTQGRFQPSPWS